MGLRFSLTVFMLVYLAVSAADEWYYREHPELIQSALVRCPAGLPKRISCKKLSQIAKESAVFLLELESNPQQYGLDIMHMQAELAEQMVDRGIKRSVSQYDIKRMQADLMLRLALIRSLESP